MRIFTTLLFFLFAFNGFAQKIFFRDNSKVTTLLIHKPITAISLISDRSIKRYDTAISTQVNDYAVNLLQNIFPDSISTNFYTPDLASNEKIEKFTNSLRKKIKNRNKFLNYVVPDSIIALFKSTNHNYILITNITGFKRTRKNLVNTDQTLEITDFLVGHGLRANANAFSINCCIIDVKAKNIHFYEFDVWNERDPTDLKEIKITLSRVITHYLAN